MHLSIYIFNFRTPLCNKKILEIVFFIQSPIIHQKSLILKSKKSDFMKGLEYIQKKHL